MIKPAKTKWVMVRGSKWEALFTLRNKKTKVAAVLTGYTGILQFRKGPGTPVLVEAKSGGDGVAEGTLEIVNTDDGVDTGVYVFIPASLTNSVDLVPGKIRTDLKLIPPAGDNYAQQFVRAEVEVMDEISSDLP